MAECFRRINEADAVILLLGEKYGTIVDDALSATHLEYRHARSQKKPIFAFLLRADSREPEQARFVDEVQETVFRGGSIGTLPELATQVRNALLQEFTRCFRETHGGPPKTGHIPVAPPIDLAPKLFLSDAPRAAYEQLDQLDRAGHDKAIQQLAPQIELKFGHIPQIAHFVHAANVNLAMAGESIDRKALERAIAFWDSPTLRKRKTPASIAYCQGNALGVLNRHEEAIARYTYALSQDSTFAMCWKNLGTAYVDVGNPGEAIRSFRQAIFYEPCLFEARYSLATMAIQQGAYQDALDQLSQIGVAELPPIQQSWVHGHRARCLQGVGDHASAMGAIEMAISLIPDTDWPWFYAARIYAVARNADPKWMEAARVFAERLASRFPNDGQVWGDLGYVYWHLRRDGATLQLTRQCIAAFSRAMELGFLDGGLIADRLGHIYSDKGALDKAVQAFRAATKQNATSFGHCLGSALMQLGQYDEALHLMKAAAERHQPDALSWGNLGTCYDKVGDPEHAIEAYEKAIALDPTYSLAWFNLGGMYWNSGDLRKAMQVWGEAVTRFPDDEHVARLRAILNLPDGPS